MWNEEKAETRKGSNGRIRKDRWEHRLSLETKAKVIHTIVLPTTTMGVEVGQWRRLIRRKMDSFEIWCWRRAVQRPRTTRRTNKWVLEQIKPETLLEAKMTELKLVYSGHIMRRQRSLEKTIRLGKNTRQQEKRKIKYEMDWLNIRSLRQLRTEHWGRHSLEELPGYTHIGGKKCNQCLNHKNKFCLHVCAYV